MANGTRDPSSLAWILLIALIIILIILAIIFVGPFGTTNQPSSGTNSTNTTTTPPVSAAEQNCKNNNGTWEAACPQGTFQCIYTYTDGETPCTSSTECQGDCVVTAPNSQAICQSNSDTCGCFVTIEEFKQTGKVTCRN